MLRKIISLPFLIILLYLLQVNLRLYHQPTLKTNEQGMYNQDLYHQLCFLKGKMRAGAASQMQDVYPEGFVFTYALYALSWANLITEVHAESPLHKEALLEIRWSIANMESDKAKSIFPSEMYLPYGVFYQGWLNYTRAAYLQVLPHPTNDTTQLMRFRGACKQIGAAIERHHTPFLFSYHGGCWPADNVVALAALFLHDQLLEPQFTEIRKGWLARMRTKVDTLQLVPHSVDLTYGNARESARGSSQSLMLAFWPQIDSVFGTQQYAIYQHTFADRRLGLPGIREYPHGTVGFGDVDAGPVLLDIGGAASVVGMGSAAQHGDASLYAGLRNSIEGFAAALCWRGKKRYLGGKLPVADAFIAWSHSRVPLELLRTRKFSKWRFHLISGIPLLLLFLLIFKFWRK